MKQENIDINYVIKLNQEGFSQKEIASKIGCVYQDIQRALKHHKIKLLWKRKHKIEKQENFFETIDSEIKAYLLGFLYADGNIDKNLNRISICISESDSYIVELFTTHIAPNSLLKKIHNKKGAVNRKPQIFLRINSCKLVADLINLGLCPRKTYFDVKFPDIPDHLIHHFIRGLFDGDGCVMNRPNQKGTVYNKIIFCINWKSFLDTLCNHLYNIKIDYLFIKKMTGKTVDWYKLAIWSHKNSLLFGKYIYNDANFFLKRKRDKFLFQNTEINIESNDSISS